MKIQLSIFSVNLFIIIMCWNRIVSGEGNNDAFVMSEEISNIDLKILHNEFYKSEIKRIIQTVSSLQNFIKEIKNEMNGNMIEVMQILFNENEYFKMKDSEYKSDCQSFIPDLNEMDKIYKAFAKLIMQKMEMTDLYLKRKLNRVVNSLVIILLSSNLMKTYDTNTFNSSGTFVEIDKRDLFELKHFEQNILITSTDAVTNVSILCEQLYDMELSVLKVINRQKHLYACCLNKVNNELAVLINCTNFNEAEINLSDEILKSLHSKRIHLVENAQKKKRFVNFDSFS